MTYSLKRRELLHSGANVKRILGHAVLAVEDRTGYELVPRSGTGTIDLDDDKFNKYTFDCGLDSEQVPHLDEDNLGSQLYIGYAIHVLSGGVCENGTTEVYVDQQKPFISPRDREVIDAIQESLEQ